MVNIKLKQILFIIIMFITIDIPSAQTLDLQSIRKQ